jgi:hypothetical protein
MKKYFYNFLLFSLLTACGASTKNYKLNVLGASLFDQSTLSLVNNSSVSDLDCLKMNFSVSGISGDKEAFIPFYAEGILNLDPLIAKLSEGKEVTLTDMIKAWSSPASISIDSSIKDLRLLVNGFYSFCYKGKPINIMFSGESTFSDSDLNSTGLDMKLTASTLLPVNATSSNIKKAGSFDKHVDNFTYVLITHNKDKFNTLPFSCSDIKSAGSTSNTIQIKPYFLRKNENKSYAVTEEFMFDASYSGYFRHDFNFIERDTDNFSSLLSSMILLPVFTGIKYEIIYTQGTGDQCTPSDTLSSVLQITKKDKANCSYADNKILACSVDWDETSSLQSHDCQCITRP